MGCFDHQILRFLSEGVWIIRKFIEIYDSPWNWQFAPENRPSQMSSSNHPFSGGNMLIPGFALYQQPAAKAARSDTKSTLTLLKKTMRLSLLKIKVVKHPKVYQSPFTCKSWVYVGIYNYIVTKWHRFTNNNTSDGTLIQCQRKNEARAEQHLSKERKKPEARRWVGCLYMWGFHYDLYNKDPFSYCKESVDKLQTACILGLYIVDSCNSHLKWDGTYKSYKSSLMMISYRISWQKIGAIFLPPTPGTSEGWGVPLWNRHRYCVQHHPRRLLVKNWGIRTPWTRSHAMLPETPRPWTFRSNSGVVGPWFSYVLGGSKGKFMSPRIGFMFTHRFLGTYVWVFVGVAIPLEHHDQLLTDLDWWNPWTKRKPGA